MVNDRGTTPKTRSSADISFHWSTEKFRLYDLKAYKASFYTMSKGGTIGMGVVEGL